MAPQVGIEPTTFRLTVWRYYHWTTEKYLGEESLTKLIDLQLSKGCTIITPEWVAFRTLGHCRKPPTDALNNFTKQETRTKLPLSIPRRILTRLSWTIIPFHMPLCSGVSIKERLTHFPSSTGEVSVTSLSSWSPFVCCNRLTYLCRDMMA